MAEVTALRQSVEAKRIMEKEVVSRMIALYCGKRHHAKGALCPECAELDAYARQRIDHCPHMETKTFCSSCETHCYRPDMRERIRAVMRFSGPRMLFHHPVMTVRHMAETLAVHSALLRK